MNDVLPKPFTKEGLMTMLDKHLSHLKKQSAGMEPMAAPPAPLSAATKRSIKTDDSPAASPLTASNWNSPHTFSAGVSPASTHPDDPYPYPHGPYAVQSGLPPGPPLYSPVPGAPPNLPPHLQQPPLQRRPISDISGGPPEMGDAKRQQMYPPAPPMHQTIQSRPSR